MWMQTAIRTIYPPECVLCRALTETDFALCGSCWRETPFVFGLVCDLCGQPLPGEDTDELVHCDDCMTIARPWTKGRTAMVYDDKGKQIVLALKHSDREDLARPAAQWLARAAADLPLETSILVPVPLHWRRLLSRRYNQSAILARSLSKHSGAQMIPDALLRPRKTPSLGGLNRDARFAALQGSITINPAMASQVEGRDMILMDDVMTSGATLAACTEALMMAGANGVNVLTLARAVKAP